jgi:hypothetical protein
MSLVQYKEELSNMYTSSNIVREIKSRRINGRFMWHVRGRGEVYTGFWYGNLRERDHLGKPGIDGRIILRWIIRKWDVGSWTGSSWLKIGTGGRHLCLR